jgi:hypothetical protein
MKRTIENEEWSIKFLSEDMIAKIASGDATVMEEILSYDRQQEEDFESEDSEMSKLLAIYEAHAIAAAYGYPEIAKALYERGELEKVIWNSGDHDDFFPSRVCPVCFTLTTVSGLDAQLDCKEGHLIFRSSSDLQTYELKDSDEIDANVFSNATAESDNFDEVKDVLFTDDVVGRALQMAVDEEVWFRALPGGEHLRIYTEEIDEDSGGDTFLYGYHPEGSAFVDRIWEYYELMIERCWECELDACDDYWG